MRQKGTVLFVSFICIFFLLNDLLACGMERESYLNETKRVCPLCLICVSKALVKVDQLVLDGVLDEVAGAVHAQLLEDGVLVVFNCAGA